jgi:hypothetical protein
MCGIVSSNFAHGEVYYVLYNFPIKTMFGSSLSLVVLVLSCLCVCLRILMSNILSYHISLRSEFRVVRSATISV